MNDAEPPAHPLTPFSAIQHARSLAAAGDLAAAVAFLKQHRGDWKRVKPNYDAALGNLLLQSGDAEAAVGFLTTALAAFNDDIPASLHRALGAAYLQLDRIEAAGEQFSLLQTATGGITRRTELLAIEAFRNRASAELDTGPATPFAVIIRAKAIAAAGDIPGAVTLLAESRKNWASTPAEYEDLHRHLRAETIDREAAVAQLLAARANAGDQFPAKMQQSLSIALFEIGRVEEAGKEASLALDHGAEIKRLDLLVAANSYRLRSGAGPQIDTTFGKGFTFVDDVKQLVYISTPKNASSLLKSLFVLNSANRDAYLASKSSIHDFCDALNAASPNRQQVMADGYFRFTVLRNPARRLLSAYLDKFVRGRTSRHPHLRAQQMAATIRAAQELAGVPHDPERSITFQEFVRYVAQADDAEFNMHWMPQWRIVGRDLGAYSHVGTVERLKRTLDLLTERFGFDQNVSLAANLPKAGSHIAKHSADSDIEEPFRVLPAILEENQERLPLSEHFLSPELRFIISERFAIDEDLYREASA